MEPAALIAPMAAHVAWAALLYAGLTIVRAPTAWGVGCRADGSNPWAAIEPRISANLKNQFEWPMLFYAACVLEIAQRVSLNSSLLWLAWLFVFGRIVHSGIQILTANVRMRGVVFTINFVAVLGMWVNIVVSSIRAEP
jgi:hypothetical protein